MPVIGDKETNDDRLATLLEEVVDKLGGLEMPVIQPVVNVDSLQVEPAPSDDRIVRLLEELVDKLDMRPATVQLNPEVHVDSPPAPDVHIAPPKVNVEAPNVNVSPPSVTVAAPNVTVNPPSVTVQAPNVTVENSGAKSWHFTVSRDQAGKIATITATPRT